MLDAVAESPETDFSYTVANGEATITAYTGAAQAVRVPTTLGSAPVAALAEGAFADNRTLTTVILPDTLKRIGEGVLADCTALQYLECSLMGADAASPQYLGYLFGADAYRNNPRHIPASLVLVRVDEGVASIPDYAFYDCNDLHAVLLPASVRSVGKYAFYDCSELESIEGLDSVVSIGEYAFAKCKTMYRVVLGDALETVGFAAFFNCKSIVSMTLPFVGGSRTENTYLAYVFGAEYPDFAKGYYPSGLARIELLEGCETLGNYALFECATLKELLLPEGLVSIGVRALYACESLWSVAFPETLTTIRENAFYGCDALSEVTFGSGLTTIGINAFYNCDSLVTITLPASLTNLPASCFAGCVALETVALGGVTSVGAQAFRGCLSLRTVTSAHAVSFADGNEYAENALQ